MGLNQWIYSPKGVNHLDPYGNNALMAYFWYAMPANEVVVKSLINSGNNPNQVNSVGDSVLHCAACNTTVTIQIFKTLIEGGAEINHIGHQ